MPLPTGLDEAFNDDHSIHSDGYYNHSRDIEDFAMTPNIPAINQAKDALNAQSPAATIDTTTSSFSVEMMGHLPRPSPTPASFLSKAYYAYDPLQRFTFYSPSTDIVQRNILGEIREHLEGDNTSMYWLDICAPQVSDLHSIAELLRIHPLTIEDIQMDDSREKCEIYEEYVFVSVRTCASNYHRTSVTSKTYEDQQVSVDSDGTVSLYILLFKDKVLSLHQQPIPHVRNALKRIYPLRAMTFGETTADWILYCLLDDVVDEFQPFLRLLELEIDNIDDLVLMLRSPDKSELLRRIGNARKQVIRQLRLLKPKSEIVRTLYKRCPEKFKQSTLLYMRDIQDHVITMMQALEQAGGTLDRSHSNYLAQISIELAETSNRMNFVVKRLTAATSLMLPLSLLSGIWGMNVVVPGERNSSWPDYGPFFIICSIMTVLMVLMFIYGRHYDWF